MNQIRAIFANTATLAISTLVVRAGGIVLALVIARLNHASGLGVYSAALAYYGLVTLASGMGATSYLVREIAKDHAKTSYFVIHLTVMGTCVSLGIVAIFLLVLPYLGYSDLLASAICVVLCGSVAGTLNSMQRAVFVAHQRVGPYACTAIAGTLVNLLVSLYLLTHGYSVISLLVAFVIQEYLVVLILFMLIHRYAARLEWRFSLTSAMQLAGEIKTFAALSLLAGLFARPEIFILSLVKDESDVGYFIAALKLVVIWHLLPQVYMSNVFPVLSRSFRKEHNTFRMIQERSIKYLLVVSLPLAAGIIVTADSIIHVLYGPDFEASILPLQLLALTIPCTALMSVLWRVLAARNQQFLDLRARIVSIAMRLSGGWVLISSLGALGAAIIVPIALVLNAVLLVRYVNRESTALHLARLSWRCALATLGMGAVTWSLNHTLPLWALVPLATIVYVALVLSLKVFSSTDFMLFRKVYQPALVEGK